MSSPEIDSNGIKWIFAHGTQYTIAQSRDNPGDHRWSRDSPGIGKGYEVTWITTPTGVTGGSGSSSGHTACKLGGPNHSGDCGGGYSEGGTCCCWYDIGIRANGDLQFQTERPHPSNHDFDPGGMALLDTVGHPMEGHSTGIKLVLYPHITGGTAENGGIHIKFWINSDALTSGVPNNNWRMAADIFDTGQILGDGYDWPDYQEIEVRNSDTDESGFFHDSVYLRAMTDADLQAARSGSPGGGGTPPPVVTPPGPTPTALGAVVNTTYPIPEGDYNETDAEGVIKDTLNRQLLPASGVDFLNTLYVVIGPVDKVFRTRLPVISGTPAGTVNLSVLVNITVDFIFNPQNTAYNNLTALQMFGLVAAEEMIEVQTDTFFDAWYGPNIDSGSEDSHRQIGDAPCDFDGDQTGVDSYSDGFWVEAYWSNEDEDCIIPGLLPGGTGENEDNLTYHGGIVQATPKIILIFWGSSWETRTSAPTKGQIIVHIRDKLLGTDSQFFDGLAQYDCAVPVWGQAVQNNHISVPSSGNIPFQTVVDVVVDCFETGLLSAVDITFSRTQFIVIPPYGVEDGTYLGYHSSGVIDLQITGTGETTTFPEAGSRHDCFKPIINIPGNFPGGEGIGGGTLPPDTSIPPPGASIIKPVVAWGVVQVIDPITSIIHASLPDWDGNNTITRPLAVSLVQSQVNTDQFARFGPAGWSRITGTNNNITESPCTSNDTVDNVHRYSDGLGVQTYWSNLANNCLVPGRGDPDLGTSTVIKYHGGRIMKNPLVVLIFWGPAWLTRVDLPSVESLTAEVKDKLLNEDKVFFSQLGQYSGCGAPQFGASVINTNVAFPASHVITLDQARAVVKSTLQNGSLPTALIDYNNTWFCVIPEYTSLVTNPVSGASDIGAWSDVFQPTIVIPGTGPEDPGGSPDPGNLETFSGVLSFKRDINMMRTSTCAGTDLPPVDPGDPPVDPPPPPGTGGTAKFYIVTGTSNQKEISNESSSDDRTIIAEKIDSSSSAMNGKLLKQADVLLKKESGTTAVTPLIYFKIWNAANTVVYTSPTTFTPNSLTTSFVGKTFDCSTNTHTLVVGDYVGVEFTGTDPDEFIWTAYVTSDSGSTGSSNSHSIYKEGSSYDNQTSRRCSFTLWT